MNNVIDRFTNLLRAGKYDEARQALSPIFPDLDKKYPPVPRPEHLKNLKEGDKVKLHGRYTGIFLGAIQYANVLVYEVQQERTNRSYYLKAEDVVPL